MTRAVYRSLLRLHPQAFRRRFAPEMLCIFDEVANTGPTTRLVTDAVISLLRQWALRSGSWIALAALIGAFIQVSVVGFSFFLFTKGRSLVAGQSATASTPLPPELAELLQLMLWTSGSVIVIVLLTTLWIRNFTRRIEGR